jgi:acyl carrier protein
MAELESRLVNCFAIAFPELAPQEIRLVSMGSLASWDSLAGITLLALIEEEFSMSISPDDAADLASFELMLAYLQKDYWQTDHPRTLSPQESE